MPFPGNMIPANRINPVAAAMLQYIPMPNTGGNPITLLNNYQISASENEQDNNMSFRGDHRINDSTNLMVRYSESFNNTRLPNVYNNVADPYNSDTVEHHASAVISLNRIFSPS